MELLHKNSFREASTRDFQDQLRKTGEYVIGDNFRQLAFGFYQNNAIDRNLASGNKVWLITNYVGEAKQVAQGVELAQLALLWSLSNLGFDRESLNRVAEVQLDEVDEHLLPYLLSEDSVVIPAAINTTPAPAQKNFWHIGGPGGGIHFKQRQLQIMLSNLEAKAQHLQGVQNKGVISLARDHVPYSNKKKTHGEL